MRDAETRRFREALDRVDDVTRRAIEDYFAHVERDVAAAKAEIAAANAEITEITKILDERLPPREKPRPRLTVVEEEKDDA